jgi:hypothetical protein
MTLTVRAGKGSILLQGAALAALALGTPVALMRVAVVFALATRAVYSFIGFPSSPEQHLYLHHDGYPTGAAWRFATARRLNGDPAAFLQAFVATQPGAEQLSAPQQAADAEYRYRVALVASTTEEVQVQVQVQVQCWRRLPGSSDWHPRCTRIALADFIQRFLPGAID